MIGTEVVIVGAGPVGMTLAIALTRLSLRVRIVDQAPQTKREARAAVIWPRASEMLADLDVLEPIRNAANELHAVAIYAGRRRMGDLRLGRLIGAHRFPLMIEQDTIERLLAEALQRLGVDIEWGTRARDVHLHDGHVEVDLNRVDGGSEVATAAWVVGAEGARSTVRKALGIAFEGRQRADLQVVQVDSVPTWQYPHASDRGYFFLAANSSLGAFPTPDQEYRFFAFTTDPDPTRTALRRVRRCITSSPPPRTRRS